MNNVIPFRPANSPRRTASADRGATQILFFTGVRYQRWGEDTHAPQPQAQSSRRKRERAQIGENERGRKSQR
jgi:hypothetical protein